MTHNTHKTLIARALALALALTLLIMPGTAGALSWSALITAISTATPVNGNITVDGAAIVGETVDTDTGRVEVTDIPYNAAIDRTGFTNTLTLKNLAFTSKLALANGAFVLDNVGVNASGTGISITGTGATDISLTLENGSEVHSGNSNAVDASHTGTGSITITNEAGVIIETATGSNGIAAVHNGAGDIHITNGDGVSISGKAGMGVYALGGGDINITNGNDVAITGSGWDGIYVQSTVGGDVSLTIGQGGQVQGGDKGVIIKTGNASDSITIDNAGAITGISGAGLQIEQHMDATLSVTNTGTVTGAVTFTDAGGEHTGIGTQLVVRVPNDLTSSTDDNRHAMVDWVDDSGLPGVDGDILIYVRNSNGSGGYQMLWAEHDCPNKPVEPDPDPAPQQQPEPQVTVNADFYLNQPAPAPAVHTGPSYRNLSYSDEYLYQAWLDGRSWQLRTHYPEPGEGEAALPEKGEKRPFTETLSRGPDGSIQLTLDVYAKREGSMLTAISMETLRKLLARDITTLCVINGDTVDVYPLAEILKALEAAGHPDCQEIWLAGMEGDAVIIDKDGAKVAL